MNISINNLYNFISFQIYKKNITKLSISPNILRDNINNNTITINDVILLNKCYYDSDYDTDENPDNYNDIKDNKIICNLSLDEDGYITLEPDIKYSFYFNAKINIPENKYYKIYLPPNFINILEIPHKRLDNQIIYYNNEIHTIKIPIINITKKPCSINLKFFYLLLEICDGYKINPSPNKRKYQEQVYNEYINELECKKQEELIRIAERERIINEKRIKRQKFIEDLELKQKSIQSKIKRRNEEQNRKDKEKLEKRRKQIAEKKKKEKEEMSDKEKSKLIREIIELEQEIVNDELRSMSERRSNIIDMRLENEAQTIKDILNAESEESSVNNLSSADDSGGYLTDLEEFIKNEENRSNHSNSIKTALSFLDTPTPKKKRKLFSIRKKKKTPLEKEQERIKREVKENIKLSQIEDNSINSLNISDSDSDIKNTTNSIIKNDKSNDENEKTKKSKKVSKKKSIKKLGSLLKKLKPSKN